MKNFKQIALGLMVGAMAIGFSAFTTANNSNIKIKRNAKGQIINVTASYYRIPADASTSTDLNASHYEYEDGPLSGCNAGSDICSSQWTTTNAPSAGESPSSAGSPSFVTNNSATGVYNGD
jgi:hypothetical protein